MGENNYLITANLNDGTQFFAWCEDLEDLKDTFNEIKDRLQENDSYDALCIANSETIDLG